MSVQGSSFFRRKRQGTMSEVSIDPFLAAVKDRVPYTEEIRQCFRSREGRQYSGRYAWPTCSGPDCELATLRWMSPLLGLFGVDHFYVRSPLTGLAKLLTGGGLGLWWLWDVVQVFSEGDRIVKYGMVTPFDMIQGIGQGMITDRSTEYSQPASTVSMTLAQIFGFLGFGYMLTGKMTVGLRVLFIQILALPCIYILVTHLMRGQFDLSIIFMLFTAVMLMFSVPIFMIWGYNLSGIYEDKVIDSAAKVLNLYQQYDKDDTSLAVTGITKKDIRDRLMLRHSSEPLPYQHEDSRENDSLPFMAAPKTAFGITKASMSALIGAIVNATPAGKAASMALEKAEAAEKRGPLAGLKGVTDSLGPLAKIGPLAGATAGLKGASTGLAGATAGLKGVTDSLGPLAKIGPLAGVSAGLSAGLAGLEGLKGASAGLEGLKGASAGLEGLKGASVKPNQTGGALPDLSVESQILGASLAAIIGGGAVKLLIDYIVSKMIPWRPKSNSRNYGRHVKESFFTFHGAGVRALPAS